MAKSKTYTSEADGPITVYVPGHSTIRLESGDSFDTDDAAVQAALDANPDLSSAKGGRARSEDKAESSQSTQSTTKSESKSKGN